MAAVVLFDIDGTLVDCGGVGRRSLDLAFAELFERQDACQQIKFGGMTDRAIVRAALLALEAPCTPETIDEILRAYLRHLAANVAVAENFRVYDGARELVEHARGAGYAVGLGTGNLREGARLKLERAGLWDLFDFGGFGCDAEARDELLAKGRERGVSKLGGEPRATVVVGDTPRDVHAAHAIGAKTLAVASGLFTVAELVAAGAEVVVETLACTRAREALDELSAGA